MIEHDQSGRTRADNESAFAVLDQRLVLLRVGTANENAQVRVCRRCNRGQRASCLDRDRAEGRAGGLKFATWLALIISRLSRAVLLVVLVAMTWAGRSLLQRKTEAGRCPERSTTIAIRYGRGERRAYRADDLVRGEPRAVGRVADGAGKSRLVVARGKCERERNAQRAHALGSPEISHRLVYRHHHVRGPGSRVCRCPGMSRRDWCRSSDTWPKVALESQSDFPTELRSGSPARCSAAAAES